MPSARYWRVIAVDTWGGGDLELSELHLHDGSGRVDAPATISSTIAPASGALADLKDNDTGTVTAWPVASYRAPGFAIAWDFGSATTVAAVRPGGGSTRSKFIESLTLQYSADNVTWNTLIRYYGLTFPGAATLATLSLQQRERLTWDPAGLSPSNASLTNNNLTAHTINVGQARGNVGLQTGKWYFECYLNNSGAQNGTMLGIASDQHSLVAFPGSDAHSYGYYAFDGKKYNQNVPVAYAATYTTGDTVGIALDLDAGTLIFLKNNVDLGVAYSGIASASWFPIVSQGSSAGTNGQVTINFGASSFTYTPPSGYQAFNKHLQPAFETPPNTRLIGQPTHIAVDGGGTLSTSVLDTLTPFRDIENGGPGIITGTVKIDSSPDIPVRRKVRLHRDKDGICVAETWSNATTGAYAFSGLDITRKYHVVAFDHTGDRRAVIADNLTPEVA
jgi:hypothetical protein